MSTHVPPERFHVCTRCLHNYTRGAAEMRSTLCGPCQREVALEPTTRLRLWAANAVLMLPALSIVTILVVCVLVALTGGRP